MNLPTPEYITPALKMKPLQNETQKSTSKVVKNPLPTSYPPN
jgi:hypothetical protein